MEGENEEEKQGTRHITWFSAKQVSDPSHQSAP